MTTETDAPGGVEGLRPEWLLERDGTRYVRYAGLLALAHARGLKRITTALVQAPAASNGHVAIAAAEVETAQGVFTGLGEAAPETGAPQAEPGAPPPRGDAGEGPSPGGRRERWPASLRGAPPGPRRRHHSGLALNASQAWPARRGQARGRPGVTSARRATAAIPRAREISRPKQNRRPIW